MEYKPNLLANVLYAVLSLVVPGTLGVVVLWSEWSWAVKAILLGIIAIWVACSFPRHYLGYTLRTSEEGFEYLPWVGRKKSVPWDQVTACRLGLVWVRLVRDDGRVHFLFERPLLVQNRASFLEELERQCPTAVRLGWFDWWRLVWRGVKEAAGSRDSR